jgi:hypothetical protein
VHLHGLYVNINKREQRCVGVTITLKKHKFVSNLATADITRMIFPVLATAEDSVFTRILTAAADNPGCHL